MDNFDMDRVRELADKREREGLTEEEKQEVVAMQEEFVAVVAPAFELLVDSMETIAGDWIEAAQTLEALLEAQDDE